jgi:alpha-mannosidase
VLREIVASVVSTDRADVVVAAVKPASRGDGIIVRLLTHTTPGPTLGLTVRRHVVKAAWLCDARERDLEELEVHAGKVDLTMPGTIATVRILV